MINTLLCFCGDAMRWLFLKQVSQIYPMELEFMDTGHRTGVSAPTLASVPQFNELTRIYEESLWRA